MKIGEYELENPLINGGGLVKTVEDARLMAATGVAAVLAGSFTLDYRPGNGKDGGVVDYWDSDKQLMTNALGMPNKGLRDGASDIKEMADAAHDHGKPFILNIAPVSHDPVGEIGAIADELEKFGVDNIDAIELNASCPNVPMGSSGDRHPILSHNPNVLDDVLWRLDGASEQQVPFTNLFVRISPFLQQSDAQVFVDQIVPSGIVTAITGFNTFPGGRPVLANGNYALTDQNGVNHTGGQSGPAMLSQAEMQTIWLQDAIELGCDNGSAPVVKMIGSNAIFTGQAIHERLLMGAEAVSVTSAFWVDPKGWKHAAHRLLNEYAEVQ